MKISILIIFAIALFSAFPLNAQPGAKPTIAVMTLKNANEIKLGEAQIISDRLRIELFRTGNVDVMEREQMDVILKEQGFQQSGACSDEGCMVEMGQLLGVKYIIAGSIGKLGSMFLLNCRSINISTGRIAKVVSVDIKGDIEDVVSQLGAIAEKLTSGDSPQPQRIQIQARETKNDEEKDDDQASEKPAADNGGSSVETTWFDGIAKMPLTCTNLPIFEIPSFGTALPFKISDGTLQSICEEAKPVLDEVFRCDVRIATGRQIAALGADCRSPVIRIVLESYSTQPSSMSQFIGTALCAISLYHSPKSPTPGFTVKIKESGDRHWGEEVPFENAMEEVVSTLEDQLAKSDFVKNFRRSRR